MGYGGFVLAGENLAAFPSLRGSGPPKAVTKWRGEVRQKRWSLFSPPVWCPLSRRGVMGLPDRLQQEARGGLSASLPLALRSLVLVPTLPSSAPPSRSLQTFVQSGSRPTPDNPHGPAPFFGIL